MKDEKDYLSAYEEIAVKFFYWWYNQKGNNTVEGFKAFKETDIYKEIIATVYENKL